MHTRVIDKIVRKTYNYIVDNIQKYERTHPS